MDLDKEALIIKSCRTQFLVFSNFALREIPDDYRSLVPFWQELIKDMEEGIRVGIIDWRLEPQKYLDSLRDAVNWFEKNNGPDENRSREWKELSKNLTHWLEENKYL